MLIALIVYVKGTHNMSHDLIEDDVQACLELGRELGKMLEIFTRLRPIDEHGLAIIAEAIGDQTHGCLAYLDNDEIMEQTRGYENSIELIERGLRQGYGYEARPRPYRFAGSYPDQKKPGVAK